MITFHLTVVTVTATWGRVCRNLQSIPWCKITDKKQSYLNALGKSVNNLCFAGIFIVVTAKRNLTDLELLDTAKYLRDDPWWSVHRKVIRSDISLRSATC